jgi:hypothetical protein
LPIFGHGQRMSPDVTGRPPTGCKERCR